MIQKKFLIVLVVLSLIIFGVTLSITLREQSSFVEEETNESFADLQITQISGGSVEPGSESEGKGIEPFITPHQIDLQISPLKRSSERKRAAILARFDRLYERKQQSGTPIKRGTPLVIDPQSFAAEDTVGNEFQQ